MSSDPPTDDTLTTDSLRGGILPAVFALGRRDHSLWESVLGVRWGVEGVGTESKLSMELLWEGVYIVCGQSDGAAM